MANAPLLHYNVRSLLSGLHRLSAVTVDVSCFRPVMFR